MDILLAVWATPISGFPLFRITQKLKNLKLSLKTWVKSENYNASNRVKVIREQLKEINYSKKRNTHLNSIPSPKH